jgi:hypothetical protein
LCVYNCRQRLEEYPIKIVVIKEGQSLDIKAVVVRAKGHHTILEVLRHATCHFFGDDRAPPDNPENAVVDRHAARVIMDAWGSRICFWDIEGEGHDGDNVSDVSVPHVFSTRQLRIAVMPRTGIHTWEDYANMGYLYLSEHVFTAGEHTTMPEVMSD